MSARFVMLVGVRVAVIVIAGVGASGGCAPERDPRMAENVAAARVDLTRLRGAAEAFMKTHGKCPTAADVESARDPWGRSYVILCPGQKGHAVDVVSRGRDGDLGTTDDVRSWD
ncbi:MAG: ral secretion pathway protein [Myxococcales bacterium]|nr:ral secretion pathway protein [Myxococcales bacterium]